MVWEVARQVAEVFVRRSRSLKDLVKRLRIAAKLESHLVRQEALRFVRVRAEALYAVFPG